MAFVNEELTPEEREWFAKRGIKNSVYGKAHILKPRYWTIDRERDAYITYLGVRRDWPDEIVLFYQLRDISMIISVKRCSAPNNIGVYSLENTCDAPLKDIKDGELIEELKSVLREALEEFKANGRPDERNMAVKVICDF